MDPKLVQALVERISAGVSRDDIKHEMLTAGYNEATFTSAYEVALARVTQAPVQKPADSLVDVGMDIKELFTMSFQMLFKNFSILINSVATFLVSVVLVGGIGFVVFNTAFNPAENFAYDVALVVVGALAFIAIMVTCFSSIVRALLRRNMPESFGNHLAWTFTHIIGITLVSCYISILTQVGYMFFIIPGIALNIFLIFSTLFVISGTHTGVAALVASTELVYGRFFKVFGRVLLCILASMVVIWAGVFLALATLYFSLPVMVISGVLVGVLFLLGFFWQLCFIIVLFEALQNSPKVETKPISTRSLTLIYRGIVGVVMAGLIIFAFLFGFFAANSNVIEEIETDWLNMETTSDVANKQNVRAARLDAEFYRMEQGSFLGVCTHITLSPEIVCESTDILYALETPLSEGFYCVDSTGYDEVNSRPILYNASCAQ